MTSNAVLCRFYQGLCPLYSDGSHFCIAPYLVHTFNAQCRNVFRKRCLLQNHQPAYSPCISINVFVIWEVYAEPSRNSILEPCNLTLCLPSHLGETSNLSVYSGRYIRMGISAFIHQSCYYFRILAIVLRWIVVIQFLRLLYMMRIHMNRLHTVVLKKSSEVEPVMSCWFHSWNYFRLAMFRLQLIRPGQKRLKPFFIVVECERLWGVFVISPVKRSCIVRLAADINSDY